MFYKFSKKKTPKNEGGGGGGGGGFFGFGGGVFLFFLFFLRGGGPGGGGGKGKKGMNPGAAFAPGVSPSFFLKKGKVGSRGDFFSFFEGLLGVFLVFWLGFSPQGRAPPTGGRGGPLVFLGWGGGGGGFFPRGGGGGNPFAI